MEVTQEQYLDLMVPDYHQGGYLKAFWGYSTPEIHQGGPYFTAGRVIPDTDVFPMESVTWDTYDPKDTTDPMRKSGTDKSETRRIARGGCFLSNELTRPTEQQEYRYIRSASRNNFEPDSIYGILGFRVVLAPKVSK